MAAPDLQRDSDATLAARTTVRTWRIMVQSVAAALGAYVAAGTAELGIIRAFKPTEWELAWISDVVLASAFGVAVYLWRHLSATRQALLDRERADLVLTTQLGLAADMQKRLLPVLPPATARVEWAATMRSAWQIGGDFYDLVPLPDGRTMLLVADVSGKGIPAAMALSTLRAAFRAVAQQAEGPAQVVSQISAALYEQWRGTPYVTCIVVLVDVAAGRLTYTNAAHPTGVVIGPDGRRRLEPLGPPAALLPGVAYSERGVAIGPGDRCVLVSDGVTESLGDGADGRVEDVEHVVEAVPGSAADVCDAVMAAAMSGTGPAGVTDWDDDRTVVVLALLDGATEPATVARVALADGAAL
jgi:sigma-B regulation protein RsbU (phosphoserine phosphatase)